MDKDSELQLGTEVEIIGPTKTGGLRYIGERFIITAKLTTVTNGTTYSASCCDWYPASSLRNLDPDPDDINEVIAAISDMQEVQSKNMTPAISDIEKIIDRLTNVEKQQEHIISGLEARRQSHEKWRDRTLEIEHRQKAQQTWLSQLETRQDNHGKRLADVEYLLNEMKKIFETKDSSVAFVVDTI